MSSKSMRDFDYFSEKQKPTPLDESAQQAKELRTRKRRLIYQFIVSLVALGAVTYFIWDLREIIAYHFTKQPQIELGNAEEQENTVWPDGAYVKISGIVETRAAQAHAMRGLSWPSDYWYVHLLGSPLFIEASAADSRQIIKPFEKITFEGRPINLKTHPRYQHLLEFFEQHLFMRMPDQPYLLQVGLTPGGGYQYIALLVGVLLLFVAHWVAWLRAFRHLSKLTKASQTGTNNL